MKTIDFNFDLPQELIAQTPLEQRDSSRLLVLDKQSGNCEHSVFSQLGDFLKPGDLLVLNNSRVIPARLFGKKEGSGGVVQFLLLKDLGASCWESLVKPGRKAKPGSRFVFGDGLMTCEVREVLDGGSRKVEFYYSGNFYEILDEIGQMPLPEYIEEKLDDKERYQTVYSKELGSAAAPTAGLHFTKELLDKLKENGIDSTYVTLHVGLGTFRPVKAEDIKDHEMHSEHYYIPKETANKIKTTKENGGRVIAVGTTACRTLESGAAVANPLEECSGDTSIFIYPGYDFKVIDGLITNFHLPQSTLVMLVSALAGRENTLNAYNTAIENKYRFYSFGDAMLIV